MRGAGIEYLPGGYTNRNYRLDIDGAAYVLRLGAGATRPANAFERRYLDVVGAPDLVAHNAEAGHLLTRWIEGRTLADAPPTAAEAGAYLAELHARIPTGIRRYDFGAEIEAMFRRAGKVDAAVETRFRKLDWHAAEWRGCHNDLNPWNIIREPSGRFRTLDWEMAGDNDRLFDLVGLCMGLGWGMARTRACVDACNTAGSALRYTPGRLRDTLCAYQIREHAWAVAQIAGGNDRPEIRQQAATTREWLLSRR